MLRGGGIGDLLYAMPAAESLASAYPNAEITLLGTPMHSALLGARPSPFQTIEVLPPWPGVRPGVADPAGVAEFFDRMVACGFDLAVQVHGGGRNSNPFLLKLGAAHTVGAATEDAVPLERTLPFLYYQHEVLRALEVVGLAGAPPSQLEPSLRLTEEELTLHRRHDQRTMDSTPKVLVHPGATDPRRRWPCESFAALAVELVKEGAEVVLIGDQSDVELAGRILSRARSAGATTGLSDVTGQTSLAELIPLLLQASVVVANDSGPRHLAAAVGISTVGIYWFGNVVNSGPLSRRNHRVQISWTTHCPVCHQNVTQVGAERCEHDDSVVSTVDVAAVLSDVRALLSMAPSRLAA
jgi:ADP-heptose:LPS heptosyltransferase